MSRRGWGGDLVPHVHHATIDSETTSYTFVLDLRGPDSVQHLSRNYRAHALLVSRIWFTLPALATLPPNNTLWLHITPGGEVPISSRTKQWYTPVLFEGPDPTHHAASLDHSSGVVFTLGNVSPGDHVTWKTHSWASIDFRGASRNLNQFRVRILQSDGTVYTDLNDARIFVELIIHAENRA